MTLLYKIFFGSKIFPINTFSNFGRIMKNLHNNNEKHTQSHCTMAVGSEDQLNLELFSILVKSIRCDVSSESRKCALGRAHFAAKQKQSGRWRHTKRSAFNCWTMRASFATPWVPVHYRVVYADGSSLTHRQQLVPRLLAENANSRR